MKEVKYKYFLWQDIVIPNGTYLETIAGVKYEKFIPTQENVTLMVLLLLTLPRHRSLLLALKFIPTQENVTLNITIIDNNPKV